MVLSVVLHDFFYSPQQLRAQNIRRQANKCFGNRLITTFRGVDQGVTIGAKEEKIFQGVATALGAIDDVMTLEGDSAAPAPAAMVTISLSHLASESHTHTPTFPLPPRDRGDILRHSEEQAEGKQNEPCSLPSHGMSQGESTKTVQHIEGKDDDGSDSSKNGNFTPFHQIPPGREEYRLVFRELQDGGNVPLVFG
jgi:hypothetical protein